MWIFSKTFFNIMESSNKVFKYFRIFLTKAKRSTYWPLNGPRISSSDEIFKNSELFQISAKSDYLFQSYGKNLKNDFFSILVRPVG